MYPVVWVPRFRKEIAKYCSLAEQEKLSRFILRLTENPWLGDALGPIWFREFRLNGKRAYFLVLDEGAGFVALSSKKNQQSVINWVRAQKYFLRDEIKRTIDAL